MKQKFLTLLALLLCAVTSTWAADSTPTYTQPTSTLDLSDANLATTLSGLTWADKNKNYGTFYKLSDDYLELPCVPLDYTIGTGDKNIKWAVQENSRGNTNTDTWNASAPFSAWTDFRKESTATNLDVPKLQATRMIAVKVTGLTEAKVYASTNSSKYVVLNVYEVGAEQGSVAYNTLTKVGTANTSSASIATVSGLDASKTYIVQAVGNGTSNVNIYAMALKRASAATQAPGTPTLTQDGGNVNGGSTTTIASSDAQKIYYCWNNSSTAPEKTAENTWTEVTGNSYEYTIPNVAATGMYLHAYGWNNYNTSSTSGIKTSAAFNVTKVKEAAGLEYATTAVEKNVSAAKFTNELTNPNNLTVTYSVVSGASATGVEVDASTGEVTVGSVAGTATIKAYFEGNENYNEGEATYTLTVVTPDPVIEAANVNIAKIATGGNIAYTVGYHSVHNGEVTADTAADWITLGAVTQNTDGTGTVAFTNSANTTSVTRYANVTLTYTYNTNQTKTTTLIVAQDPDLVGFSIIKVAVTSATNGTVSGTIGGTATVDLQNSEVDGGYKFGTNGNSITLTLANSKTFQEGDVIVVHTTKAADTNPGILSMYSGSNMVLDTETRGIQGINAFALPAAADGKTTIAVKRVNGNPQHYNWNGYVDYIEVIRATTTVTLNSNGYATYSAGNDFTFSGAQAYKMALTTTSLQGTEVDGKIKAGEGILFKGEAGATVTLTATTGASALEGNNLKGTTKTDGTTAAPATGKYYYVLSGKTFKPYTGTTFATNKAYFETEAEISNSIPMTFADDPTAINNVNANDNANFAGVKKFFKNGKLVIETANGTFTAAGAQVK